MNRKLLASLAAERAEAAARAEAGRGVMIRTAEPTQAQIEKARSRSLFIATPIARRPTYQFTMSLAMTTA